MKPGTRRTPVERKKLTGTYRPDRDGTDHPEPTKAKRPRPPKELTKEAKREWRRVIGELEELGMLTTVDLPSLAIYCQACADWLDARRRIAQYGDIQVIRDENGNPKYVQTSPYVSMANKAAQTIRQFAAEFGFTPSARASLGIEGKRTTVDEAEEWLKRNQQRHERTGDE